MSKTHLPGFTAEASLYETTSSYRSRESQPGGGEHPIVAQHLAAPSAGLVFLAACCKWKCTWWGCECIRECEV